MRLAKSSPMNPRIQIGVIVTNRLKYLRLPLPMHLEVQGQWWSYSSMQTSQVGQWQVPRWPAAPQRPQGRYLGGQWGRTGGFRAIWGLERATVRYEPHCRRLREQVMQMSSWFQKLVETVQHRKQASRQNMVNPATKQQSTSAKCITVGPDGDQHGALRQHNHVTVPVLGINLGVVVAEGLMGGGVGRGGVLDLFLSGSIYVQLVMHFAINIIGISFILMICLWTKIASRSLFNNLVARSMSHRHELDVLTKLLYGGVSQQKDTHKSESHPIKEERKQNEPKNDKKKKEKPGKAEKGEEDKKGGEKVLGFEIKTPKGTRDYYPHQMAIRRKVIDSIVEVFKKHGGVEIDTPVFELKQVLTGKYGEDSKLIYDLEDQGGEKCSLRYDLTVPFARFMANNTNIQKIKRFHIGKVYRRDQPTVNKGRFREFYQCDFDIAGKYDLMMPDAEVLAIMQQILETVGVDGFLVKVNHRKILEMMIKEAACDESKFKAICSSIDKLDKMPWAEVKAELINSKGVTQEQADVIGKLTQYKGSPRELLQQIINENIFVKTGEQVKPYLEQMGKLFEYLEAMERISKVSFDLSLARGLDYYTGLIYEIVLTDKTTELGSISGGGRYDDLIGMFCQYQIPSVGGSIGIERLFTILEKQYADKIKENACEVLVATIRNVPVGEKLRILSRLWKSNIKAETLYVEKAKPDKQIAHAFGNGIPLILWIGEDELKSGQLNLKILYKHEEVKVPLESIGEAVLVYVEQFRKDYELGKVELKDPKGKAADKQK